jgi:hypothetical protein
VRLLHPRMVNAGRWTLVNRRHRLTAVADYEASEATRQAAATRISQRFRDWVNVFENDQPLPAGAA